MRYKLVDVIPNHEEYVTFGTCEICMWVGNLNYNDFIVEDVYGNRHVFTDGHWSWGDWIPVRHADIENVIQFAEWFAEQDLPPLLEDITFWNLIGEYAEKYQEVEEWQK